jgi:hypothetical protein
MRSRKLCDGGADRNSRNRCRSQPERRRVMAKKKAKKAAKKKAKKK